MALWRAAASRDNVGLVPMRLSYLSGSWWTLAESAEGALLALCDAFVVLCKALWAGCVWLLRTLWDALKRPLSFC